MKQFLSVFDKYEGKKHKRLPPNQFAANICYSLTRYVKKRYKKPYWK